MHHLKTLFHKYGGFDNMLVNNIIKKGTWNY